MNTDPASLVNGDLTGCERPSVRSALPRTMRDRGVNPVAQEAFRPWRSRYTPSPRDGAIIERVRFRKCWSTAWKSRQVHQQS